MTDAGPDFEAAFAAFLAGYQAPAIEASQVAGAAAEARGEMELESR